jgi:hypothetical protein
MTIIPSSPEEHDMFLTFKEQPIRIVMREGIPLFALPDICEAFGLGVARASTVRLLPEHAKDTYSAATDDGLEDIVMLTPFGVWLYGHLDDPGRSQAGAAWVRRESLRLCPDADPGNPAMFITLEPDGSLPPRPMKYSGRRAEWDALRDSNERLERIANRHLLPSPYNDARAAIMASLRAKAL